MRILVLLPAFVMALAMKAAPCTITIDAPDHIGKAAVLYRYMDLFSMRREVLAVGEVDGHGSVTLTGEVAEIMKGQVRIGMDVAEFYLKPGANYTVRLLPPERNDPRSLGGASLRQLEFLGLDRLDVNALTSDLNEKLDAFVAEDLATDQVAGMQARDLVLKDGSAKPESVRRPATLFVNPGFSEARVDTFELKLRKYYAGVSDVWFSSFMESALAGLRFGPGTNDSALFARALQNKPVRYNDPEYVRFFLSFFEDHLLRHPFLTNENELVRGIAQADMDSLKRLFSKNVFLTDDRLCELVVLNELYANYHGKTFDRSGIRSLLAKAIRSSNYSEHRSISANMFWDLTTMQPGDTLPSLMTWNTSGEKVELDTLLAEGPVYIAFTASWCTYCELELSAMEKLHAEYGKVIRFITIDIDGTTTSIEALQRLHPARTWPHLLANGDPLLLDKLRLRSVPAFFLLDGPQLKHAPAKSPSAGIAADFHRIAASVPQEGGRRVWDD
ncbi:MAG: TlpA family protein disulfide reductase [Flavobacteriales bacterium]|nr:TlpA family protein disulfide reductase [Flavobacteriales bacterium]